ncbi:MAG: mechanosensitive ion channel family protein [archaeon]|nr:mechanosensitive ion channel family protein [archaeon]
MNILDIIPKHGLTEIISTIIIIICAAITFKIISYFLNKLETKWDLDVTLIYILNDFIKYIIIIMAFGCILSVFGIDLQGIIVSLGVIGVILGIASKDIVSNFLSGLFVLSDKTVRVGDIMEVSDYKGTVKKIGFRNTTIINQKNQLVTIPNSLLNSRPYRKFLDLEDYRIDISVQLPFDANLKQFEIDIKQIIKKYEWVNKEHKILIKGDLITEEGPKMIVSTWVKDYKMLDPGKVIIMNEITDYIYNKYKITQ